MRSTPSERTPATAEWRRSHRGIELCHSARTELAAYRKGNITTLSIREDGRVPFVISMPNTMAEVLAAQLQGKPSDGA
jgi:hypothetical protein